MTETQGCSQPLRLGTRSSALAQWQSNWVASQLTTQGYDVEIIPISTAGDISSGPIGTLGAQGVFTKEIQRALLAQEIDFAVHSLKDLPTDEVPGLCLASVPLREAVGDVLVTPSVMGVLDLPAAARVGTGSLRRAAQVLNKRPDVCVTDIRGNVDTRLEKLDAGEFDAIILAESGLKRLGLDDRITHVIPHHVMLPAVGQGALGIECRVDDDDLRGILDLLCNRPSFLAVAAERSMLAELDGGCLAPVGGWARFDGDDLVLNAVVLNATGTQRCDVESRCNMGDSPPGDLTVAVELGRQVALELIQLGAAEYITQSRSD